MIRKPLILHGALLLFLSPFCVFAWPTSARELQQPSQQQPGQQAQPDYTIAQYNAFQAARAEKDPKTRIKMLDDLTASLGTSKDLLVYIYQAYLDTYTQLKDNAKIIEYADKVVALGDKVAVPARLQALAARTAAFEASFDPKAAGAEDRLKRERDAASMALQLLTQLPKPENVTDAQFADQKKPAIAYFKSAEGFAALQMKDFKAAVEAYKGAVEVNPKDAVAYYRIGVAYLQENPPQYMDGFWAMARAIGLKIQGEAQVRDYLRKQLLVYQQTGCDNLVDAQMNELIQLATNSADRPATYSIPSSADLDKIRQQSNILTVLTDLKAGGDKAKMTWLAICGSEFPEVVGKIIEVTPNADGLTFKVYTGASEEDMEKAATANMEVRVVGQPDTARLQKEDGIRFSGTLAGYDPEPFMLHWDKVKVDPKSIPEKAEPGTHRPHRIPKKPGL
jgi:tetratricopeptide (TPR) repeat protein